MTKWEQFEYILKCLLPSYRQRSRLSLSITSTNYAYSEYTRVKECRWKLVINRGSEVFEDIKTISDFCGIYWEHMTYSMEHELILELTENKEEITPIYW